MGGLEYGLEPEIVDRIAAEVRDVAEMGVEICLVIGGGNIFRGVSGAARGNGPGISGLHGHVGYRNQRVGDAERAGARRRGHTRAIRNSNADRLRTIYPTARRPTYGKGQGGYLRCRNGNPFFTTDTAAALRASEMNCDLLLKATKVDGVYSADPCRE